MIRKQRHGGVRFALDHIPKPLVERITLLAYLRGRTKGDVTVEALTIGMNQLWQKAEEMMGKTERQRLGLGPTLTTLKEEASRGSRTKGT